MENTQFDLEHALSRNTTLPPIIPSLETEADQAAPALHAVPQIGVAHGLEEDPGMHQSPQLNNLADLDLELRRFQDAERRRFFGSSTPELSSNRRQELVELNDEDYMQDEDEDEDEENESDSTMELDPALSPPVDDASRESSPDLQMQGAGHGSHGEHRSERPRFETRNLLINVLEVVGEVQDFHSDQDVEPVNSEFNSVPAEHSLTSSNDAWSMVLGPNSPKPVIEEGLVREVINHVRESLHWQLRCPRKPCSPTPSSSARVPWNLQRPQLGRGESPYVYRCRNRLRMRASPEARGS